MAKDAQRSRWKGDTVKRDDQPQDGLHRKLFADGTPELSQTAFAGLMGVSLRTLQDWEQGRRQPAGSARMLLRIAQQHPEIFLELA